MQRLVLVGVAALAAAVLAGTTAIGDHEPRYRALGDDAQWTTVLDSTVGLEGLTSDRHGNLYTPGRGVAPCPILRTTPAGGAPVVVGNIAAPCNPTGLAFDKDGDLFIADGARIVTLRPNAATPPTATVYAEGVPGANGVAFDRGGRLWVSDGATAQGRVWRIGSDRLPVEMFRVQPMANEVLRRRGRARQSQSAARRRSRSRRPAARPPTRSARSTWWPTASRSTATATCSWPTPRAVRSGTSPSTTGAA